MLKNTQIDMLLPGMGSVDCIVEAIVGTFICHHLVFQFKKLHCKTSFGLVLAVDSCLRATCSNLSFVFFGSPK